MSAKALEQLVTTSQLPGDGIPTIWEHRRCLSSLSQSELDAIALRLNTRPRETLGFRTPADKLQASVASTP